MEMMMMKELDEQQNTQDLARPPANTAATATQRRVGGGGNDGVRVGGRSSSQVVAPEKTLFNAFRTGGRATATAIGNKFENNS